jgi:hypothetical protein
VPAYAAASDAPNVQTWSDAQWSMPACLPWPHARARLVVAVAGSLLHNGDSASLVARFGAISTMRGIRYWSVTESAWRILITDAFALDGPSPLQRRADFKAEEIEKGGDLYFAEQDNRSGLVSYRMRAVEVHANRVVIVTENITAVRAFGFTLFPPGSLRAAYFVQRLNSDTWGFYGLSVTGEGASALSGLSEASYVNRATALYRHFTGQRP